MSHDKFSCTWSTHTANLISVKDCMSTNLNSIMHSICFTGTVKINIRTLMLYKNVHVSHAYNVHLQLYVFSKNNLSVTDLCGYDIPHWFSIMTHYNDVIMSAMGSEITGVSIVYSLVCSGADQRKHQSSASLAFGRGIHRSAVNSPHKGPITQKIFSFDDVIMDLWYL